MSGYMTTLHSMPPGAQVLPDGGVRFRLWAPHCDRVTLDIANQGEPARNWPMVPMGQGWHELLLRQARAGARYSFVLPDGTRVPDPTSRFQPEDVHGPSEVIDPAAYRWNDAAWRGRPWHEAVVYELHIGAFTRPGTFSAARERLDHLAWLGVTAIEIMPVADFPGRRNWGYDGVLLYAPDSSYGRPEDFKALVDAAHARGIMVFLDVVYNHFGPDGNFLPLYAPAFFTDRHHTPWGAAINFDGVHSRPVREFIIQNALYWIEEFHLDGLRLDAVHAIADESSQDVLDELAQRVRAGHRVVHLVLENEENQTRRLVRDAAGRPLYYTAQWNDDVHHALHVAATGEGQGYYTEYVGDTEKLGRALAQGFAFQGEMMVYRGSARGEPSAVLPPTAFVAFLQNHDQIGNRAFGDRLTANAPPEALRALAAVYLLLPQIPMLFMGEEWHAAQPFPFFCDFEGDLADLVREGRRREFARFPEFQHETSRARIPDPQADSTFESAKLNWAEVDEPRHRSWLNFYRRLIARRQEVIVPLLPVIGGHAGTYEMIGPAAVVVRWRIERGGESGAGEDGVTQEGFMQKGSMKKGVTRERVLTLAANLSRETVSGFPVDGGRALWEEGGPQERGVAGPWSVHWSLARGT